MITARTAQYRSGRSENQFAGEVMLEDLHGLHGQHSTYASFFTFFEHGVGKHYTMLHMTSTSFNTMIAELLQVGYLQENGNGNPYGANRYDTTIRYENIRALSRNAQVKEIAYDVASFAGHFCGAFCSENVI